MDMIKSSILLLCLLAAASCTQKETKDAVTGATSPYKTGKDVILPPKSDTYKVQGVMRGVKGFVVKYDSNLYRGGELMSADALETMKIFKIKTIVSITPNDHERAFAKRNNIKLVEIPFDKTNGVAKADLNKYLALFTDKNTPIYVHCHGGTHRGGTLGAAYRIHKCGWDHDKTMLEHSYLGGSLKDDHIMLQSILQKD